MTILPNQMINFGIMVHGEDRRDQRRLSDKAEHVLSAAVGRHMCQFIGTAWLQLVSQSVDWSE